MKTANEVRQAIANFQNEGLEYNPILRTYAQELNDKIGKMITNRTNCFVHNVREYYVGEVMKMLTDKGFNVRISNTFVTDNDRCMVTLIITL